MEEDGPEVLRGEMNIDEWVHFLHSQDPDMTIDQDLVMLQRAAFMLRSVCLELGLRVRLSEIWRLYCEQLLVREGVPVP